MYTSILNEHHLWNKEAEEVYTDEQRKQDRNSARIRGILSSGATSLADGALASGKVNILGHLGANIITDQVAQAADRYAKDKAQSKDQETEIRKLVANRRAGNAAGGITGLGMLGAQFYRGRAFGKNRTQTALINAAAPFIANNATREYLDYIDRNK